MRVLVNLACVVALASISVPAYAFDDDFEREDGPVDGWLSSFGTWEIIDGRLTNFATGEAPGSWVWAGGIDDPERLRGDSTIEVDLTFGEAPLDAVGRHGGLILFASQTGQRNQPGQNGYLVDWIDRELDHGFRIIRIDNGAETVLINQTPEILDPPEEWVVEVVGPTITVIADGLEVFSVDDSTYREGHFGVWAFQNQSVIEIDAIDVTTSPLAACITATPEFGGSPLEVTLDGSCSNGDFDVVAWRWDFGDGSPAEEGVSVEHTFEFPDPYVVTLEVEDSEGNTSTASTVIVVSEGIGGLYEDDFERDDGPVDDWTVFQGEWNILDGELTSISAGQETWAWAGDPALVAPEEVSIEFEYRFLVTPPDGVGRHGGVVFCADQPTQRYALSGYTLDWIDREADHGFRFVRFDAGVHGEVFTGGSHLPDPPEHWRLAFVGDQILIWGDGELLFQHTDATYRGGHFGFWAWQNNQEIAIDNFQVSDEIPSVVWATRSLEGVDCDGNATVNLTVSISGDDETVPVEITENLPAGSTGVDAGAGSFEDGKFVFSGDVSHGETITYTLTGVAPAATVSGTLGLTANLGARQFGDTCPYGCDDPTGGFSGGGIRAGVVLGPILLDEAVNADCFDGGNFSITDYLINVDGDLGEEELGDPDSAPVAGDVFAPDFGGLAGGLGVQVSTNDQINPGGAEGELTAWLARADQTGYIDYNLPENIGDPVDNYAVYSFHYLDNTTGDPLPIQLEIGTDDGVKVRLNGELIHENAVCRGVPGYGLGDMVPATLEDGMNVLMVAVVERGGGTGLRLVLRDEFGDPLTPFDDEEALVRVCKAATDGPRVSEDCDVEGDEDGNGLADCDDPACEGTPACPVGESFVRGDADSSGSINLTDGVNILLWSFQGGAEPSCLDAADTDNSGAINLSDPIRIFQWLFLGGAPPVDPEPSGGAYIADDCGIDSGDDAFDCGNSGPVCSAGV